MSATTPNPVYLVRGDDAVLLAEAVRTLVATLIPEGDDASLVVEDLDLDQQSTDDHGVGAVLDACLTPPFLTGRRVVLARNAGVLNADEAARVVQYLADPLDTTALVLVGGGGTVPAKLVTAVKGAGELVDAGAPRQARERTSWIVDRLKKSPLQFDARAGQRLAEHLGEAGGVAPWDLTDALDKGDAATALGHLHRLMTGGDRHPLVVLATLHRHYGQMLRLDGSGVRNEAEAAQVLGLKGSTFPARKALSQSRRLGGAKVRRAIALVAEADLDLRGQKSWPDGLVMEVLVARLAQLSRV
jgi:DNA polymerase-3 subunit delta